MHACTAGGAGITTPLRGPSVARFLPGFGALVDEVFLPLFGLFPRLPVCFGMQVVLLILENLLKALCCLKINGFVVLVKCFLPIGLTTVMESISPLPGSQGGVSLSPAELRFIARCIWSPGVFADVQDGDAVSILVSDLSQKVWVRMLVGSFLPCFPNGAQLHNHLSGCCGVFCQCH